MKTVTIIGMYVLEEVLKDHLRKKALLRHLEREVVWEAERITLEASQEI